MLETYNSSNDAKTPTIAAIHHFTPGSSKCKKTKRNEVQMLERKRENIICRL